MNYLVILTCISSGKTHPVSYHDEQPVVPRKGDFVFGLNGDRKKREVIEVRFMYEYPTSTSIRVIMKEEDYE